jgi:succinate dehydrogenase/fumarate reductase cytochrome b subunit
MFLKSIIVILFIAILVSLFSGLRFLVKDMGNSNNRVFHSLAMRVTLAAILIGTIAFGFSTGQLGSKAPWDQQLHQSDSNQMKK